MNMMRMKQLLPSDNIALDDWNVYEYDSLKDLNFENDGIYSMTFEYDELVIGKEKYLKVNISRKQDCWILKYKTSKDGKFRTYEFKKFQTLMKTVHDLFYKF